MEEQPKRRRGRPRKVVVEPETAAPGESAPAVGSAEWEAGESDASAARFDGSWSDALRLLRGVDGIITRITFPGECPELYTTVRFGCPVVRGDRFTARLDNGRLIEF